MDEVRRIRRRMSKRLLEAERREGSCVSELRRMGREAASWMNAGAGAKSASSSKSRRKAE